jgi:hypothetical protein
MMMWYVYQTNLIQLFSEVFLFDKIGEGTSRKLLLELMKDTVIKLLIIPNTTFLTSKSMNSIFMPRVSELKLIHNFTILEVNLTEATLEAFPNLKRLDLSQICLDE